MSGSTITITASDGSQRSVPFEGLQLRIGRTPDNDLVLDQGGVSSRHCVLGRDPTGAYYVQDQGSTNGTWIGDQRVQGTTVLQPGTKLVVGSYVLSVVVGRPVAVPRPMGMGMGMGVRGPLLRKSEDEHRDRRFLDRVARYAQEWDESDRPRRLLLRGRNLRLALERIEGRDPDDCFGEVEETFIRVSAEGRERAKVVRIAAVIGGVVALLALVAVLATRDWGGEELAAAEGSGEQVGERGGSETGADRDVELVGTIEDSDLEDHSTQKQWIEHKVIPAETLEEIALRYDVTLKAVSQWNGVGESEELAPGRTIKVKADPNAAPLPHQNISYRTVSRESWSSLAKRFDVPVDKLRAYNPGVEGELSGKTELSIWIDPKPLKRKADVQIPEFTVRQDAISVGAPKGGKLTNGIQFPRNDALYKRRKPYIMWCGSFMAAQLQYAIAKFRYSYEFEGEVVVADMSQKHGGLFNPHKSHQSGRDVDIWLPTLKGVYKKDQLTSKTYRPMSEEADWFALYGFLKALHETEAVHVVFLDYTLHDRVYKAAKLMGANDEELSEMIAYPRGAHHRQSLLQHSPGHVHHIHVRFKCGPNDEDCSNRADPDPGD